MTDVSLGSLSVEAVFPDDATVLVARPNLADPTKQIFDRVTRAAVLAGVAIGSGNVQAIEIGVLNLVVPPSITAGTATPVALYQITDVNDLSNLLLEQIEIQYQDNIGAKFTYEVWAGNPTANGSVKLASASTDIFFTQYATSFRSSATAFLANSSLRTGLFLNVINRLTSTIKFSAKLSFLKLPQVVSPVTLPTYTSTPFVYTGPSNLNTVEVGPGQTFPEMADAMPYVAAGFTMNVHAGSYFKPFIIPTGMDGFTIQAAPGITADDIVCNGRGGWVTGYPFWTDNVPAGSGPVNPFRLAQGKGFILARSPGTIRKLGFWYCGGGLGSTAAGNIGDGEAGIYAEQFAASSTLTVERCTFDGNENGIFVPTTGSGAPGNNVKLAIDHCDFSFQVNNGQSPDGLSHNVYVSGAEVHVTNSNFYSCNGNSFKSRSPVVTIAGSFMEAGAGRCIDYPDGGSLAISTTTFSQNFLNGNYPNLNYMGFGNESAINGAALVTISNSNLQIGRVDTRIRLDNSATVTFSSSSYTWYTGVDGGRATITYDVASSGVTGIPFPATPGSGGTIVASGIPPRPVNPAHLT